MIFGVVHRTGSASVIPKTTTLDFPVTRYFYSFFVSLVCGPGFLQMDTVEGHAELLSSLTAHRSANFFYPQIIKEVIKSLYGEWTIPTAHANIMFC